MFELGMENTKKTLLFKYQDKYSQPKIRSTTNLKETRWIN